jgi:hypothetical protein
MNAHGCNGLCGCDDPLEYDDTQEISCECGYNGEAEGMTQGDYFTAECPKCGAEVEQWEEEGW